MKVRVLTFHHISTGKKDIQPFPGITTPRYKFILLLLALKLCRYKCCLFHDVPKYPGRKCIVLNFDDGYESVYQSALPVLSFFGWKAHVCITGESLTNTIRENKLALMGIEEARLLKQKGWDFINHTMHHTVLVNQVNSFLELEINKNADAFKTEGVFLNPDYFCLPEGKYDETAERYIHAAGYKYILTTEEGIWDTNSAEKKIPRINISSQPLWYAFYKIVFKFRNKGIIPGNKQAVIKTT